MKTTTSFFAFGSAVMLALLVRARLRCDDHD